MSDPFPAKKLLPVENVDALIGWLRSMPWWHQVEAVMFDALITRVEALERFVRACDAVDVGVLDFDLHHAAVKEMKAARRALD